MRINNMNYKIIPEGAGGRFEGELEVEFDRGEISVLQGELYKHPAREFVIMPKDVFNMKAMLNRSILNSYYGMYGTGMRDNETPIIKEVIFNDPATIVLWMDGTKTVVKCTKGDTYDKEKGLALCIIKKICSDNDSKHFHNIFKTFIKEEQ